MIISVDRLWRDPGQKEKPKPKGKPPAKECPCCGTRVNRYNRTGKCHKCNDREFNAVVNDRNASIQKIFNAFRGVRGTGG